VIVVEGLFDLASLWQAGFANAVALLGSHFNERQRAQLWAIIYLDTRHTTRNTRGHG
jgi:DNA primase